MNETQKMMQIIEELFPINRSICSPGLDQALEIIKSKYIPDLTIDRYPTGSDAWTWVLPQKWSLAQGSIRQGGKTVISTTEEPLCVWSGSLPVKKEVSGKELLEHVYSESGRPDLLCWYYRYYGKLDWGFNLPYRLAQSLSLDANYEVEIDSEYYDDDFHVGYVRIPGKSKKTILITSDICHPYQCNDSLTGVAVSIMLFNFLKKRENNFSYLFSFVPETIGTIALLSHHEDWISDINLSFYSEFWGRNTPMRFQKSLKGDTAFDLIGESFLKNRIGSSLQVLPFRKNGIMNDEWVTMMTGLWIPSIAMNRGMYPEYHSHHDTPDQIHKDSMQEAWEVVRDLMLHYDNRYEDLALKCDTGCISLLEKGYVDLSQPDDFVPIPLFRGPVFLSRYGLWVDWREQPELNAAMDLIMGCMDGVNSVMQISKFVGVDHSIVIDFINQLERCGLVKKQSTIVEG